MKKYKNNIKVLQEEIIKIKAPTKLIIGDPSYLDAIEENNDVGCMKKLCLIKNKLPGTMNAEIIIKEVEDEWLGYKFKSIYIDIIAVSNKIDINKQNNHLEIFKSNRFYPSLVSKQFDLGCDTACFEMTTNKGYYEFKTGADGSYGNYTIYKNNLAYHITLALDADLFDFDEIVDIMKYLFKEEK